MKDALGLHNADEVIWVLLRDYRANHAEQVKPEPEAQPVADLDGGKGIEGTGMHSA